MSSEVALATLYKQTLIKLIHGGLRYLESAQFGLVRESLHERALLLKLAPELVKLQTLHIPIYEDSKRGPLTIRAGLSLYALLSGMDKNAFFCSMPKTQWTNLDGLQLHNLRAVFSYQEAQTDDAALTRAVLQSAQSLGAELHMPARFISAERHAKSCNIVYEYAGRSQSVSCRVLINCAGPWARQLLNHVTPAMPIPEIELVQGSHLLLPPLLKHHYYLEAPEDKRAVFALPWQGKLLLGTTELIHREAPEKSHCTERERAYLLATLQHYFPGLTVDPQQVDSFAGLRVLPKSEKTAFSRPREVLFDVDNEIHPRVLSVMGGKLTTYRATAQMALARLQASLPHKEARADTRKLPLSPVE